MSQRLTLLAVLVSSLAIAAVKASSQQGKELPLQPAQP